MCLLSDSLQMFRHLRQKRLFFRFCLYYFKKNISNKKFSVFCYIFKSNRNGIWFIRTGTAEYPSFKKGLLLQLVNVKIYFYITSLLTAYFIPCSKNAFSLALWGIFAVNIGSLASLIWAFAGVKIQKIYLKYFQKLIICKKVMKL